MRRQRAFTLVELVVTLTLIGIVATLVAMPLLRPFQGFMDTARRANMSEMLDNASRRVTRELRNALPNSPRQLSSGCIEFLPTLGGGRYRIDPGSGVDPLNFSSADSSFDVLAGTGTMPVGALAAIYNLGIPGADAYAQDNTATISAATASKITLAAAKLFPFESPGNRFHVIPNNSVVYACVGVNTASGEGQGKLVRYTQALGSIGACQAVAPAGATLLLDQVSSCSFTYSPGSIQRDGILLLDLEITHGGESVRLFHETHINNVP